MEKNYYASAMAEAGRGTRRRGREGEKRCRQMPAKSANNLSVVAGVVGVSLVVSNSIIECLGRGPIDASRSTLATSTKSRRLPGRPQGHVRRAGACECGHTCKAHAYGSACAVGRPCVSGRPLRATACGRPYSGRSAHGLSRGRSCVAGSPSRPRPCLL